MSSSTTEPNATQCVIYAAKSTKDRHLSIPEQLDDCREMAAENGWEIVGEFTDENFTAYTGNRGPGLAAAIQAAKDAATPDQPCMLVAQHTSRFARGDGAAPGAPRALVELWHEWARANVRGRLVENDLAMATSSAAAAQGEADHNDSKRKSRSVKKGLRRRARDRGKLSGGPRPFGYCWVGPKGEKSLVVDTAEAEVIVRIFEDTVNGVSQRSLARRLIEEGIPTVTGVDWGQATIGRILMNPAYRGAIRHDGEVYEAEHEAIISSELWERANAVRTSSARRKGGRWPKGPHLLVKGMLRCGRCGYAMIPRTDPNRGSPRYEVYECRGRNIRGVEFCSQRQVQRQHVDEALLADLTAHYIDLDETRRRIEQRVGADLVIARDALAQAEADDQNASSALARIERDYIDGRISAEKWNRLEDALLGERDAAAAALEQAREHVAKVEQTSTLADADQALVMNLEAIRAAVVDGVGKAPDLNALRNVIGTLFEMVVLLPADHRWMQTAEALKDSGPRIEGGYYLIPFLAGETVEDGSLSRVVIRKTPLPFGKTGYDTLTT